MRLVVDTNILISALLLRTSLPARLVEQWRQGRFALLTSAEQLEELMRVTRYPRVRERLVPQVAGRLINELRDLAVAVPRLQPMPASPDPDDDYLLAMVAAGKADYLVTGDKSHLLALGVHQGTKILSVRSLLALHDGLR